MLAQLKAKRGGFTLIELLVVIVVIAVLAMIVIPKFTDSGKRSKEASLRSDLAQLRSAVATYQTDTGYYPSNLAALTTSTAPTSSTTGYKSDGTTGTISASDWHGPYLTKDATTLDGVPVDPIDGGAFNYSTTSGSVGTVTSHSSATALDNTTYDKW